MTRRPVVRVALDMPLRRLFDYLPPETLGGAESPPEPRGPSPGPALPPPGVRVRVPFGRQRLIGMVLEHADSSDLPEERLKPVLEVLDAIPILDTPALGLLRWAAEYYHHPIGEVVSAALPKALRLGASTSTTEEYWSLTANGFEAHARGEPKRGPKQRKLLDLLAASNTGISADVLTEQLPNWRDAARQLVTKGWIGSMDVSPAAGPDGGQHAAAGTPKAAPHTTGVPTLSDEQRTAVETVGESLNRYGAFVLHGVTGSGKTEVYLRLVERVLAQDRRALVLVPEIGLTPQLVGRFKQRFDVPMAVLHSALTDHERLLAWREAFSGRARIVIGTRSRRWNGT